MTHRITTLQDLYFALGKLLKDGTPPNAFVNVLVRDAEDPVPDTQYALLTQSAGNVKAVTLDDNDVFLLATKI
jgi:hypothetical protein